MSSADLLMGDKISIIETETLRFVIMDCPTNDNLRFYLKPLKLNNVKHLVRVCEPTYSIQPLNEAGIEVHELPFPDGQSPPSTVLNGWLDVVEEVDRHYKETNEKHAIAVHCVAGLGRAPVLVATALIEKGMKPLDAIEHIRKKRRGAFNNKQIQFLDTYKKRTSKSMSIRKSFSNMFRKSAIPVAPSTTISSSDIAVVATGSN